MRSFFFFLKSEKGKGKKKLRVVSLTPWCQVFCFFFLLGKTKDGFFLFFQQKEKKKRLKKKKEGRKGRGGRKKGEKVEEKRGREGREEE